MSKKLIAVASAFALSAAALVAVPANAAALSVTAYGWSGTETATNTAKTPVRHLSPITNTLNYDNSDDDASTETVVRFFVDGLTGDKVTVEASGGVKLLEEDFDVDSDGEFTALEVGEGVGSLSFTFTSSDSEAEFFAYTTSTTAGTVKISANGNTQVFYVASYAGPAYNVSGSFPATVTPNASDDVYAYATVTDVFGNKITGSNYDDPTKEGDYGVSYAFTKDTSRLVLSAVGATVASNGDDWIWNSTKGAWKSNGITTTLNGTVALRMDLDADDLEVGFDAPIMVAFSSSSSASLADQVKSLTAQVAALQAIVDRKVTKKRFNKLARKWNAAFPGQKVALKK